MDYRNALVFNELVAVIKIQNIHLIATYTFESQFNVELITYITGCIVRLWNLKSRLRRAGHPEMHGEF